MPIKRNENLRRKIYNLLLSRGYDPVPKDSDIKNINKTVEPEEGDVIKFTFNNGNGEDDNCYIGLDGNNLTVYYDEDVMKNKVGSDSSEMDDSFFGFLKFLRQWSYSNGVKHFKLDNKDNLTSDMAQRTYMKKKEQIAEGYYSMGKQASYSDAVPTVKIILQHTRQIQEGEQRYRNVAKIFLENTQGERILAPTLRPGIAQVYARHLAEGGVPNDERWNHMKSLCEEYSKMAGFVRATKNHQFNESAQELVNTGVDHYIKLRETLGKLRGHKGYNTYFESWTPTLMEDEGDYNTINELFVQETMDPRIESVLPILNKLRKNVSEMKEVDELAEWADNLTEAPGAMTLKHNQNTEKSNLKAFDLEEDDDAVKAGQTARDKIKKPAFMRKAAGEKPATLGDVERSQQHRSSQAMVGQKGQEVEEGMTKDAMMNDAEKMSLEQFCEKYGDEDWVKEFYHTAVGTEEVEESGLQAYLGNKKYGKAGMDALRKAGRDGASKEKMAQIRAKYDKLDEEGVEEGWNDRLNDPDRYEEYLERLRDLADYNRKRDIEDPPQKHKAPTDDSKKQADESVDDMHSLGGKLPPDDKIDKVDGQDRSFDEKMKANTIKHLLQKNPSLSQDELKGKSAAELISMLREGVAEGISIVDQDSDLDQQVFTLNVDGNKISFTYWDYENNFQNPNIKDIYQQAQEQLGRKLSPKQIKDVASAVFKSFEQGVAEDLDANQKRVGQLGPTEKVKNNNIGKLVGANESLELNEMDKSQPSSDRGGESSGNPYSKGGKATPVKAKDAEKDAEKALEKSMDKAHKKDVKEGQEDLDAILRIIRK